MTELKCPRCGEDLESFEYIDSFRDEHYNYIEIMAGMCPKCKIWYEWREIYKLTEITDLKGEKTE